MRFIRFITSITIAFFFSITTLPADSFQVVCTTGMIGDLAKAVVGPHAKVKVLMGAGVDPHLYKPTRSDIASLGRADIVFYNGLLLEGKMTDALIRVAGSGKPVVAVTEKINSENLLEPESFEGLYDPHVWMDPFLWQNALTVVHAELVKFRPKLKDRFDKNASGYAAELEKLAAYAEEISKTVPKEQRVLVTAHDAFNYFGVRFGFEVNGIQGLSTESEAGVRHIEDLVDLLTNKKITAVFIESTVPSRSVHALIEGAKSRDHKVKIGGELFSDAMGSENTYEGTYIGMIDHNVTTIVRGLGGSAPRAGMQGKLKPHE